LQKTETSLPFVLAVVGATLIIINGLWIASNGAPIVLSSYPSSTTEQLYTNSSSFWGRISLGIPGYADSAWLLIFLAIAVVGLMCALGLLIEPRRPRNLSLIILACSLLSIPIGGGFIVGAILGIIGGIAGMEWPKPFKETFMGRFLRVLKLDSSVFMEASDEPKFLSQGAGILILANVLSAAGFAIYSLTVDAMNTSADATFNVLFLGQIRYDISVFAYPFIYIGIAVIKWFLLSLLIYFVGTKIVGCRKEFDGIATVTAFAYAPILLQIFLPLVFSNQTVLWGFVVFFVTNIWMILALLIGVRQALEIPVGRTVGVILLSGGIYWIIDYLAIVPFLEIPGIWFILKPATFVLLLFSMGALLASLTGIFSKRFRFE